MRQRKGGRVRGGIRSPLSGVFVEIRRARHAVRGARAAAGVRAGRVAPPAEDQPPMASAKARR
ncbi:hypothetical protein EBL87_07885 [Cereibacter sphaeroides]|nr:hypothetical protein EBL87_07885 [Cereibacter sphaeroides]